MSCILIDVSKGVGAQTRGLLFLCRVCPALEQEHHNLIITLHLWSSFKLAFHTLSICILIEFLDSRAHVSHSYKCACSIATFN